MLTVTSVKLINKKFYLNKISKAKPKEESANYDNNLLPSCYSISFGQIYSNRNYTLQGQIKKLSIEQYPSAGVLETANKILENDPDTQKTIYDAHNEYYAPLLNCNTLEEAKELYPEFQEVIDAKDLNMDEVPLTIKRIAKGQIEGVNIKNASLLFLKQYYGKMGSIKKKEDFFGLARLACNAVFKALNIKKMDSYYMHLYASSKPAHRQTMSDMRARVSTTAQYKKNASEASQRRWNRDNGAERIKTSEAVKRSQQKVSKEELQRRKDKQLEAQRTPEYREAARKRMNDMWNDPVRAQAIIDATRKFYKDNPECGQIRSQAWLANEDVIKVMSETMEDFPRMRYILAIAKKRPLTQEEENYKGRYFAECRRRCPDMYKKANGTFSKMWAEYKKKRKD